MIGRQQRPSEMFRLCISLLSLAVLVLGQALEETDNRCIEGKECVHRDDCAAWSSKRSRLNPREKTTQTYRDLLAELREEVCNKKEKGVCCPALPSPPSLPPIGECGKPRVSAHHIVGGEDTPLGEFPFAALLGTNDDRVCSQSSVSSCWICGGTLINARYVLTAAHCLGQGVKVTKVRLGEHEVTRHQGKDCLADGVTCLPEVQDFDISQKDITVHPGYEKKRAQVLNDVALIRLPRPAIFNAGVQPACLPTLPELVSEKLNVPNLADGLSGTRPVVVGWGHTHPFQRDVEDTFNVGAPKALQQMLEVPVLSSSECGELFLTPETSQICAGGDRGKDSCRVRDSNDILLSYVSQLRSIVVILRETPEVHFC